MAETITKGDFVELEYTGKTADGAVFDTTSKDVADEAGLQTKKDLKPVTICVGEQHVLAGIDKRLEGTGLGNHTFIIPAEEGFGKKSAKNLQLIPRKKFKEQGVQPIPGLEINVDNQVGTVRSVSGGRVIVDFNHPLAGKELTYEVDVKRKVTGQQEKLKALLDMMRVPYEDVTVKEGKATVSGAQQLPPQVLDHFKTDLTRLAGVDDVAFAAETEDKKPSDEKQPAASEKKQ
ncbi:peptidylprolyl isomerase [Candidatus Woesearchaeota archaeon]|nr:peptidylprolyl isomerase [Candidatus Woesearchaeota archaeon]